MANKNKLAEGATLFERLFHSNEDTLKELGKENLEQQIKMSLVASVHAAKSSSLRKSRELDALRGELETFDLEAILDLKAEIADLDADIASTQDEYATLFGTEMPAGL